MKICASCGASLPDQARVCINCNSTEFVAPTSNQYPQQNGYGYQQQDQYTQNDYGYQQQGQYAQDDYGYQQQGQYAQDDYGYDQQDQYAQDDYGYDQQDQYAQDDYGYDQQGQYAQDDYGYDQQDQYAQDDYGYDQQDQHAQDDYGYDQQQYSQSQEQYGYQQQEQYGYEQQPQQTAPIAEPQTSAAEQQAVKDETPAEAEKPVEPETPAEPEEPKENPYEVSKNFKFEKKEKPEGQGEENKENEDLQLKDKILKMFTETTDHSLDYEKEDAAKNKKISIIALFGITFWVPFVFSPQSRYARYYGNQGLIMFIMSIPFSLLYLMFSGIVGVACTQQATVGSSGASLSIFGIIMDIVFFAICYAIPIFMLYNAIKNILAGKAKDLPFFGFMRLVN